MSSGRNKDNRARPPENGQREALEVTIMSFGYKEGAPPLANLVFDVRFLKNPYWVEELRPLTGRQSQVQDYVLQQPLAAEFLGTVQHMLDTLLPKLQELGIADFTIAFGCTGGQHRSVTMVEALAAQLQKEHPQYKLRKSHRELDRQALPVSHSERSAATSPQSKAGEDR